jgi:hypothetical protein
MQDFLFNLIALERVLKQISNRHSVEFIHRQKIKALKAFRPLGLH